MHSINILIHKRKRKKGVILGSCTKVIYDLFGFILRSYLKLDYQKFEMQSNNILAQKLKEKIIMILGNCTRIIYELFGLIQRSY